MAKQKVEKIGNDAILAELERKYGMGRPSINELIITSTGSVQLDQAMKIGGTALGKIVEIFGAESSGKSTIMLHQIAEYQKAFPDRKVALFDYEHSFDPRYATNLGVDVDKLLIYQPDNMESGYDMILGMIEKDLVSCVVVDSQTAAPPKAVVDGEMSDSTIALQARINSKFCLKVKGQLSIHGATLFFVSQTRDAVGSMGETTITTGGKAIKFYADIRWKLWKTAKKDDELNITTIDVIKSKVGVAFGQAVVNILWGKGFDTVMEILDYAENFGIIKRGGSWYSYGETKLGQGIEKVKQLMDDNPELYDEIREKVINKLKNPNDTPEKASKEKLLQEA
jgi:recombination protein RecA